jgi:hypothetical protein
VTVGEPVVERNEKGICKKKKDENPKERKKEEKRREPLFTV